MTAQWEIDAAAMEAEMDRLQTALDKAEAQLAELREVAREVAKASHTANTDPDRMHSAWDALDDALNASEGRE